jgi:membrane protein
MMQASLEGQGPRPSERQRVLTFGQKLLRLLRDTAVKWNTAKAPRLGAALAYYTVFSLAPLLVIAILIAGALFGQAAAQQQIVGQIGYLMGPQGAAGVSALIAQRPFPGQSGTVATLVSVATLILGAVGVFGQLKDAFNTVWNVTPPPTKGVIGFLTRHLMPFGMVMAFGFLLLVATLLNTVLTAISTTLGPSIPYFSLLNALLNVLLPLVVTTLLFAALFKYVPDIHLAWRDLWPGAVLTAVLFTIGKLAIGLYLGHSSLGSASGAVGSLLVVLLWVYYSSQILLFGAVFTQVYTRYQGQPPASRGQSQPALTRSAMQRAPARVAGSARTSGSAPTLAVEPEPTGESNV